MFWLSYIVLIIAVVATGEELKRCLMMMQQNSYRPDRYRRWLDQSQDSTSVRRLLSGAVVLASLSTLSVTALSAALVGVASVLNFISLKTAVYKKPLVWTPRVKRIYGTIIALVLIVFAIVCLLACGREQIVDFLMVTALACYCFSHLFVVAAVWILSPVESHINKGYYNDAARILSSMPSLKIVGITGSYGKTSTKHYLHRILSEHYETLMTPGSFNTPMGVIRTIREQMKPYTQVFICEMGAKQRGDIREICDIVHPSMGIITAVGPMHLETFKSIENVQKTKFELADAIPADGMVVVNNDFAYCANREVGNTECI
ncbi:MAG: hypothetical protein J1E29_08960, partial [Duncaniella sp.]|nr:hypothetical protein [Duncaniella sp.]